MREENYRQWLTEKEYGGGTIATRISRVKTIEKKYGDLENRFQNGTYDEVIQDLQYSSEDAENNLPNPSRIEINGNIYNGLASLKNAAVLYRKFLQEEGFQTQYPGSQEFTTEEDNEMTEIAIKQKLADIFEEWVEHSGWNNTDNMRFNQALRKASKQIRRTDINNYFEEVVNQLINDYHPDIDQEEVADDIIQFQIRIRWILEYLKDND